MTQDMFASSHSDQRSENNKIMTRESTQRGGSLQAKRQGRSFLCTRLVVTLLLMLVVGVNSAWGQDYSGVYYIANDNSAKGSDDTTPYSSATDDQKYYLVPAVDPKQSDYRDAWYSPNHAETPGVPDKPFLTTYHTNKDINSIWVVKKTGNYYHVIHAVTGKYVIYEVPLPNDPDKNNDSDETKNGKRKTMHLQTPDDETGTDPYRLSTNNNFQFKITLSSDIYRFQPRNRSGWYWNPANGNKNKYYGQSSGNNEFQKSIYYAGIVGVYNDSGDGGSKWHFENAKLPAPTIEYDTDNGKFTISYDKIPAGFEILYTTDNSEPTIGGATTSTFTGTPVSLADGETVKAVVVRYGMILTETASAKLVLNPTITLAETEYPYTGSGIEPAVSSVKDGEATIDASEYTVGYSNNINAGNSATVTITDKAGGDYIVYGSTTFTINPASVTLTANSGTEAYDGTEKTLSGFTCNVNGLTFEGVTASGSGTSIGNYPVTFTGVTIDTTKDTSGNYVVSATVDGTLTITPRPLTITADSDTKVYDGTALTKNSYTSEGLMAGDVIESVTITGSQTNAGSSDNVPSAAVIKKGDDVVTANYTITYTNGTLEITKKPVTVTVEAKSKAYGEADPALTYSSEGLINDDVITGALSRDAGENAGVYAILQGTLTAGNNYAITYTGANLTITKVGLTITANNNTITYGAAPAGNGATYEGFVNSDTESALGGTLAYDYNYTQYGDVGNTYTITPKGLTSGNYDIIFVDGTLTVTAKEVVINWTNTSFAYNGEEHCPTATATDLVNDDEIGITVTGAQTNAGEHTATASALTGDKAGNYVLPEANTQTFTISSKSIGDGTNLADGYTLDFGENNSILLTDDAIGCTLVAPTDYTVGEDTSTSDKYSQRTVTGTGNYTGSFDVRNAKVSLTTDASEEGWSATFAAEAANPSDIGHALPEGIMAFIITGIRGEWAIPEPLTYIPAGVPVLLVATKKLNGFVVTTAEIEEEEKVTSAQIENNMLEEVTETTPGYNSGTQSVPFATKQIYLLYNNEFVFNKAGNLKKGKVYLNPNHAAPSLSPSLSPARLQIAWKQTTGIQNLQDDRTISIENGVWYTIDGRRLNGKPSAKGLYIVDGKKTVVK